MNPLRNAVLLVTCTIMVVLAAVNWWVVGLEPGTPTAAIGADTKVAAPVSIAPPPDVTPLSEFAEIVRRPLFSADRRAFFQPGATSVPLVSAERPPEFRLTGVAIVAQRRQALLQAPGQPQAQWIEEGGRIDGWLLQSVRDNAVILIAGQRQYELRLYPAHSP